MIGPNGDLLMMGTIYHQISIVVPFPTYVAMQHDIINNEKKTFPNRYFGVK
jgi:hypothetical protein